MYEYRDPNKNVRFKQIRNTFMIKTDKARNNAV